MPTAWTQPIVWHLEITFAAGRTEDVAWRKKLVPGSMHVYEAAVG